MPSCLFARRARCKSLCRRGYPGRFFVFSDPHQKCVPEYSPSHHRRLIMQKFKRITFQKRPLSTLLSNHSLPLYERRKSIELALFDQVLHCCYHVLLLLTRAVQLFLFVSGFWPLFFVQDCLYLFILSNHHHIQDL